MKVSARKNFFYKNSAFFLHSVSCVFTVLRKISAMVSKLLYFIALLHLYDFYWVVLVVLILHSQFSVCLFFTTVVYLSFGVGIIYIQGHLQVSDTYFNGSFRFE